VTIAVRRVFSTYVHGDIGQLIVATTAGGDTKAAAIGRKVGKVAHEVTLIRVEKKDGKQRALPGVEPAKEGKRRVTVEGLEP
jgi:orotate phosphoribosyltransferase